MERRAEQFKALGDPLRLRILVVLQQRGETCVCELVDELGTSQGNISTHLRTLRQAGLIVGQKLGKWVFYRLEPAAMAELLGWLTAQLAPAQAAGRPAGALYAACCAGDLPLSRAEAQEILAHGPAEAEPQADVAATEDTR